MLVQSSGAGTCEVLVQEQAKLGLSQEVLPVAPPLPVSPVAQLAGQIKAMFSPGGSALDA